MAARTTMFMRNRQVRPPQNDGPLQFDVIRGWQDASRWRRKSTAWSRAKNEAGKKHRRQQKNHGHLQRLNLICRAVEIKSPRLNKANT